MQTEIGPVEQRVEPRQCGFDVPAILIETQPQRRESIVQDAGALFEQEAGSAQRWGAGQRIEAFGREQTSRRSREILPRDDPAAGAFQIGKNPADRRVAAVTMNVGRADITPAHHHFLARLASPASKNDAPERLLFERHSIGGEEQFAAGFVQKSAATLQTDRRHRPTTSRRAQCGHGRRIGAIRWRAVVGWARVVRRARNWGL